MLILDSENIRTKILSNGEILAKFPWLHANRTVVDAVKGCSSCSKGTKEKAANDALAQIKRQIGNLSASGLSDLKRLLGGGPVRVYWLEGNERKRLDF